MAEILKVREITIDTMQHKGFNVKEEELKLIRFYQNDLNTAKLLINVTHDKVVTDFSAATSVQIAFLKPDCKRVFQDVQNVNQMQGKYYVVLSTQTLIAYGNVIAQLRFTFPNNKVIETCKFAFTVDESIMSDDAMKSTNEFPVIQKAIEAGKKLEGVDIDGIIAAGAKAEGAVKKSGDTMTGNLTVPRLYAGPSPDKQANVGTGSTDVYLANTLSKKYLQLKDDGALLYSNVPVALGDTAQMQKITLDSGGATISISDASKNILDEIKTKGPGMNTIYCAGGVQGQTPNNKSWRGVSFLNSANYGLLWAKDFQNKFFTNYFDNGNWLGWIEHSDASLTQNIKVTQDNGDSIIQAKVATDDILQMVLDKGRGFHTIYAAGSAKNVPSSAGLRGFANLHGTKYGYIIVTDFRNKLWTNYINGGEWQGWVNVNGNDKDGRATLSLTANATAGSADPSIATRRGNTVTIRIDASRNIGSSSPIVTNIPVDMTPTETYKTREIATDGTVVEVLVRFNGEVQFNTEGKRLTFAFTYVVN